MLKLGKTGKNPPCFRWVGEPNQGLNVHPMYGHAIHLLVASIFYKFRVEIGTFKHLIQLLNQ